MVCARAGCVGFAEVVRLRRMVCASSPTEAISGVISSIGSVGPGIGELGAMDNFSAEPSVAKFVYAFDMFLGRVEIYPVLVVLSMMFNRGK